MGLHTPLGSDALLWLVAYHKRDGLLRVCGALSILFDDGGMFSDLVTLADGRKREGLLFASFTFAQ